MEVATSGPTAWTEDRFNLLKQLNGNMTNAAIAREINAQTGSSFTRNSIIGKRAREGLITERKPAESKRGKHPRNLENKRRARLSAPDLFSFIDQTPEPPEFLGLSFDALFDDKARWLKVCRYPRGEGPYLFCGQPVKAGSSYCPHCHSLCYDLVKTRESRRNAKSSERLAALP